MKTMQGISGLPKDQVKATVTDAKDFVVNGILKCKINTCQN